MDRERKAKVIRGLVELDGKWVNMSARAQAYARRRKKIEDGYVQHNGQWLTIDEKLNLLHPPAPVQKEPAPVINYHINVSQDQRTFHEHKHVHLDPASSAALGAQALPGQGGPQGLPGQVQQNLGWQQKPLELQKPEEEADLPERDDDS